MAAGTNPRNPDTDGDGLLDGADPYPLYAPKPPDADGDGDVDSDDFEALQDCATGPELGPVDPVCTGFDFDGDGDTDSADFAVFQRCISGAGGPYDPACVD